LIRVFVADDQALVRQGIRALLTLDPEMTIVGEASDGDQAVALISRGAVDVVLLDIRMPRRNGLEVLRDLEARDDLPPTIVLTTFEDTAVLLEAIRIGARGFLLKDISFEQLVRAIRSVASGSTVFHPSLTQRLIENRERLRPFDSLDRPDRLTDREIEVVRLMAGGYSNREIAEALGTAEGTIKNHVSNVLSKFGVRDRTRAVLKAPESGVL
jgi:DNA-binding NarL/FixJ family response regulator